MTQRHILKLAAALAVTTALGFGWYWGDPVRAAGINAVIEAAQIG